jgi:hypothetical protein
VRESEPKNWKAAVEEIGIFRLSNPADSNIQIEFQAASGEFVLKNVLTGGSSKSQAASSYLRKVVWAKGIFR